MTSLTEPLIGSPNSYKKLLHNSYKNNRNWAQIYDNEELMMVDEKKEDEDCVQYFNWDTKEEIEFAILKNEKDYDYFQSEIQET